MSKIISIASEAVPVLLMISLIPIVLNDYALTVVYAAIIAIALAVKRTQNDFVVLVFGFFIMIISEYLFVSTGVEIFQRKTLFGLMPLWLPFLWSYGFVVMKRSVEVLARSHG